MSSKILCASWLGGLLLCVAPTLLGAVEPAIAPVSIPKALVVVGPWGDQFRWREALHAQGIMYDEAYRAQNAYHGGVRIVGLPTTLETLDQYSVVVLANVDAASLGAPWLKTLQQYVSQGGGLVVLGGNWAFLRGGYTGTPLGEMLPVTFADEYHIPQVAAGLPLKATNSTSWKWPVSFDSPARAFYVQTLMPKESAKVELRAGEKPALISGQFGRGRVLACSLTIHGQAAADTVAFWDWNEWPKVLGQTFQWAADGHPTNQNTSANSALKPLTVEEISQLKVRLEPLTAELAARFAAHPSAAAASAVFDQMFSADRVKISFTPALIDALAQHAQPDWERPLLKWVDSLNPDNGLRLAALELLGAARGPSAATVLLPLIEDKDVAPAAIDGLRRLGNPAHRQALLPVYERSVAKADFRNPDGANASGPVATLNGERAIHAAATLYALGDERGVLRMVELHREIRLLRRIFANASKRRVGDTDLTGQAIRKAIYEKHDDLRHLESALLNAAGPVPESQRSNFITFAKTATDEADIRWLASALQRSASGEHWQALTQSSDGIIRRLTQTRSEQ